MATLRTATSRLAADDRGVAAVVGFVLILAAAITVYSYEAQNEVPRMGARNEGAWQDSVGDSLATLAQSAAAEAGAGTSVRGTVAAPPAAPSLGIPFLRPIYSARASATVQMDPECGGATLNHSLPGLGTSINDLVGAGKGCLRFISQPAYAESVQFVIENGGIVRVQGSDAIVLAGPSLTLSKVDGRTVAAITLVNLSGLAQAQGIDSALPIELTPKASALEVLSSGNAEYVRWDVRTAHADAWARWFDQQIAASGLQGEADAVTTPTGVRVDVWGPNASSGDVVLSVSYGRYDVTLG